MKYFVDITNIETLRQEFRTLCFSLHPDKGGDRFEFGSMKEEYEHLIEKLARTEATKAAAENRDCKFTFEGEAALMEALQKFMEIPGITIEICGSWLWIAGNTFPVYKLIKNKGAKFSKSKKKWYFSPYMSERKRRGHYSMNQIRKRFGTETVESEAKNGKQ